MSKKVVWNTTPYQPKPQHKAGTYGSYREFMEKSNRLRAEQEKAQAYLEKAKPAMAKLLEMRLTKSQPLTVMRPLRYRASVMKSELNQADDVDASFYGGVNAALASEFQKAQDATFVETIKTINPGTQIVLKSLDPHLREFVFQDALGEEHAISYDDRDALMTQTDVFETVKNLLEGKGE